MLTKYFFQWHLQRFKEYSNDLRNLVIRHFLNGFSDRDITHKVLIPRTSIISKYKSTKYIRNIIGRGRKKKDNGSC